MWRRRRRRDSEGVGSGAAQRLATTYTVLALTIGLMWLLPVRAGALVIALIAVHLALWLFAGPSGWRMRPTHLFRRSAAAEMARRGLVGTVLIEGVAGWGWPVGLYVVTADALNRDDGLAAITASGAVAHAVGWSLAGAGMGLLLWALADATPLADKPAKATAAPPPPRRIPPRLSTPPSDDHAAELLLSSRA